MLLTSLVSCQGASGGEESDTVESLGEITENVSSDAVSDTEAKETEPDYTAFGIPMRAEGSTLRIIVHNIRTQTLTPSKDRADKLAVAMEYYNADILALQETDELWHRSTNRLGYGLVDILSGLGYKMVPLDDEGEWAKLKDENDRNAIFYRENKVKLIENGYDRYEVTKALSRPDCAYTWALFEEVATAKRFVVISTHFISGSEDAKRTESANELVEVVDNLEKTYNVPVMVTGDLNSTTTAMAYRTLTTSGLVNARSTAKRKIHANYATTNEIGSPPKIGSAIDHCLYTKDGFDVLHYETLICSTAYSYSDHVPMLIDFLVP